MRTYAIIENNRVVEIQEISDEDIASVASSRSCVIDIEDISPRPAVGWILEGNSLKLPTDSVNLELFEIDLNDRKSTFGVQLVKDCVNRIGARNKILNKSGAQVSAILTQLLSVKFLLETGALGTARSACSQLVSAFPEYADVFTYVITKVNRFESENGL